MAPSTNRLPTIAACARSFTVWVAEDDLGSVRAGLLRASDDLRSLDSPSMASMCEEAPAATGSDGVDAAVASLVKFTLERFGQAVPEWVALTAAAAEAFFIVPNGALRDLVVAETPHVFSQRNVVVSWDFFESV